MASPSLIYLKKKVLCFFPVSSRTLQNKCHITELVGLVVHMLGPGAVLSLVLKGNPVQVLIVPDISQIKVAFPQPLSRVLLWTVFNKLTLLRAHLRPHLHVKAHVFSKHI